MYNDYTVEKILEYGDLLEEGSMRDSTLSPKFIEVIESMVGHDLQLMDAIKVGAALSYVFNDLGIEIWVKE